MSYKIAPDFQRFNLRKDGSEIRIAPLHVMAVLGQTNAPATLVLVNGLTYELEQSVKLTLEWLMDCREP